jgi:hypothetical protein
MVRAGWRPVDPAGALLPGAAPPKEWRAAAGPSAWLIAYRRPGAANAFRLQASLQPATGRLFVHASEMDGEGAPLERNIQVRAVGVCWCGRLGFLLLVLCLVVP